VIASKHSPFRNGAIGIHSELEVAMPQQQAQQPQHGARTGQRKSSTVLVAYDATGPSDAALRWARERAGEHGRVVVAHVVEPPSDFYGTPAGDQIIDSRKRQALELLQAVGPHSGDRPVVQTRLLFGDPARALAAEANAVGASEVVAGSSGKGRIHAVVGSVCHGLLRHLAQPLVAVPPGAVRALTASFALRTLVVAASVGGAQSADASQAVARIAHDSGANVVVVGVADRGRAELTAVSPDTDRHRALMAAERMIEQLATRGVATTAEVLVGDAPKALGAIARDYGAGLVAVTEPLAARLLEPLAATLAGRLLRDASFPVLVIPAR
jgi:nucleotide-binding universal stress UspA family protein